MKTAAVLQILVTANTKPATAALAATQGQMVKTSSASNRMSGALKTVGKVGAVGAAAGLGFAVKKAADFEAQLDSLGSVSGASGKQMERLRQQAMKAGADTKFSALEAAKAQTELAKGGLSVAQISKGGLKSALALAAAGELDLAEAAETTANSLNLFGLRGKDAMKVADMLATAANSTTADVSDFGMALKQGGAVAKMAGLSFSQTVLALEALAKSGVRNSDAGTSMKTAFIQLLKPSEKQAELAKQLGLNFVSASGRMKSMADISTMLRDKLGGMTKAQRTAALATLAGTDGVRTLNALYEAGPDKLNKWEAGLNKAGTAATVAAQKQDNLKGKLENLRGSVETLAIKLGTHLLPALTDGAIAATNFLNKLSSGQGAGNFLSGLGSSLGIARQDMQNFGQAATNIFTAIKTAGRAMWPGISQATRGALNNMIGFVRIWSGLLTLNFRQVWKGIKQIVQGTMNGIVGIIRASPLGVVAVAAFNAVRKPAVNAFNAIKGTVTSVFNSIKKIMGDVIAGVLRRFASLFDIAAKIPGIGSKFKGLADRARESATQIDKVGESVRNVPSKKDVRVNVGVKWPPVLKKAFPAFGGGGKGDGWPLDQAIGAVAKKGAQATVDKLRPEDVSGGVIGGMSPFGPLGTAKGSLGKYESIGHRMGLKTTSGLRPGDPGWHGQGRARDLSNSTGPTPQMLAYARFMAKNFGGKLLELIYTPLGFSIKNGKKVPPYAQKDHFDHVHVAAQRGSMVPGSGSGDKVRALLEPGEGIINKKAVTAMGGAGAIHAINAMVPRFQQGGVAKQDPRAKEMGFLQGLWGRVAPLLGQNPNRKLPTLFKHMRLGASNTHSAAVTWDEGTWNNRKGTPSLTWASSLYSGKNKLSQLQRTQLFIHEMAHRFQNRKKTGAAWWLSEGGAEAFSQYGMRQLGLPVQASSSKYGGYANRVIAEKGWDWVQRGQFMQHGGVAGYQKGGVVGRLVGYAKGAGFKGRSAAIAAAVAMAESGGRSGAHGDRNLGGSYGLWQIHHPSHPQYPIAKLLNPAYNAKAAYKISGGGRNWGPWTQYRTGAYKQFLGAAMAALKGTPATGKKGKPKKGAVPTSGRSGLSYEDRVALADEGIAKAERTSNLKPIGRMDDIRATRSKMRLLRGRKKKIGARLRKINKALKGKLKPATRKRLLDERTQLLGERGSITTELGTLTGNLQGFKTGETTEAGPAGDAGEGEDPQLEAARIIAEAVQAHAQAMADQAAESKALREALDKQTNAANSIQAIGERTATRLVADMISGQLGGFVAQRGLTAGDGVTKARY